MFSRASNQHANSADRSSAIAPRPRKARLASHAVRKPKASFGWLQVPSGASLFARWACFARFACNTDFTMIKRKQWRSRAQSPLSCPLPRTAGFEIQEQTLTPEHFPRPASSASGPTLAENEAAQFHRPFECLFSLSRFRWCSEGLPGRVGDRVPPSCSRFLRPLSGLNLPPRDLASLGSDKTGW